MPHVPREEVEKLAFRLHIEMKLKIEDSLGSEMTVNVTSCRPHAPATAGRAAPPPKTCRVQSHSSKCERRSFRHGRCLDVESTAACRTPCTLYCLLVARLTINAPATVRKTTTAEWPCGLTGSATPARVPNARPAESKLMSFPFWLFVELPASASFFHMSSALS